MRIRSLIGMKFFFFLSSDLQIYIIIKKGESGDLFKLYAPHNLVTTLNLSLARYFTLYSYHFPNHR